MRAAFIWLKTGDLRLSAVAFRIAQPVFADFSDSQEGADALAILFRAALSSSIAVIG
jgi:hypothetical protein